MQGGRFRETSRPEFIPRWQSGAACSCSVNSVAALSSRRNNCLSVDPSHIGGRREHSINPANRREREAAPAPNSSSTQTPGALGTGGKPRTSQTPGVAGTVHDAVVLFQGGSAENIAHVMNPTIKTTQQNNTQSTTQHRAREGMKTMPTMLVTAATPRVGARLVKTPRGGEFVLHITVHAGMSATVAPTVAATAPHIVSRQHSFWRSTCMMKVGQHSLFCVCCDRSMTKGLPVMASRSARQALRRQETGSVDSRIGDRAHIKAGLSLVRLFQTQLSIFQRVSVCPSVITPCN